MSRARAVGVDVGASGVRASALADDFSVVGRASAPMATFGDPRAHEAWRGAFEAALLRLSRGLPATAIVCAGTTGGCASFLATGAAEIGDGVTALGSTLVVKLLRDNPISAPQYGICSHRIGDRWLAGGASNAGGRVIAHLFPKERLDPLTAALKPTNRLVCAIIRCSRRASGIRSTIRSSRRASSRARRTKPASSRPCWKASE